MFGLLEANHDFDGIRFAIGLRNANDKSMRLGMVAGYRVFVCDNMAFAGDFNPLLAKHSKNLDLIESVSPCTSENGQRVRSMSDESCTEEFRQQ